MEIELDAIDEQILQLVQANGQLSNLEIAEQVGLSPSPCSRRIKRLEEAGVITRYVAILDPEVLGYKLTAYVGVAMDQHTQKRFGQFQRAITSMPEVLECSIVTGQSADFLLKVVVKDMSHYEKFLLNRLTKIEGVTGVHTSFVLRKIIEKTELPIDIG